MFACGDDIANDDDDDNSAMAMMICSSRDSEILWGLLKQCNTTVLS